MDIPGAIAGMKTAAAGFGGLRGEYLAGLALCFEAMWDLAMEILGKGAPVPYERCVMASCGQAPEPSDPVRKRERVAELLGCAGRDRDGPARRRRCLAQTAARIPWPPCACSAPP